MRSSIHSAKRVGRLFFKTSVALQKAQRDLKRRPEAGDIVLSEHKQRWAQAILEECGVTLKQRNPTPELQGPTIFVGNHISYLDIPLVMSVAPISFVSKKEVGAWPIIGAGCRLTQTILVDRSSLASRKRVGEQIAAALLEQKRNVCIFPSGTTDMREAQPWFPGAFKIAHRYGIPVVPFRLRYHPMRPAAYIDKDVLFFHLWKVMGLDQLHAEIEFHQPIVVGDPIQEAARWHQWCQEYLASEFSS